MNGQARAPAAGTILNALANERGAAFAIDVETTAAVELTAEADCVSGSIADAPAADTALIERCVSLTTARFGDGEGGRVHTESEIPIASGLKSSSAAANATVLATLDALDEAATVDRIEACRIGVQAARDVGVTVTGAFDDAAASMLGGVAVTDNREDRLIEHDTVDWSVLVWTPPEKAYSAAADVERCRKLAGVADGILADARAGAYGRAMTVNGLAFGAALEYPLEPLFEALPAATGVSLSGTGPSMIAVGDRNTLNDVETSWSTRDGTTWHTTTQTTGTRT